MGSGSKRSRRRHETSEENIKNLLKAKANNCQRYNDGKILVDWRSNVLIRHTTKIRATIKSLITNAQTRRNENFSALTLMNPQYSIAHNSLNIRLAHHHALISN